jgi:hypothetical protein
MRRNAKFVQKWIFNIWQPEWKRRQKSCSHSSFKVASFTFGLVSRLTDKLPELVLSERILFLLLLKRAPHADYFNNKKLSAAVAPFSSTKHIALYTSPPFLSLSFFHIY